MIEVAGAAMVAVLCVAVVLYVAAWVHWPTATLSLTLAMIIMYFAWRRNDRV